MSGLSPSPLPCSHKLPIQSLCQLPPAAPQTACTRDIPVENVQKLVLVTASDSWLQNSAPTATPVKSMQYMVSLRNWSSYLGGTGWRPV